MCVGGAGSGFGGRDFSYTARQHGGVGEGWGRGAGGPGEGMEESQLQYGGVVQWSRGGKGIVVA